MRLLLVEPYGGALRLIFSSFVRFPAAIDGRPPASLWTKKREINWNASLPAGGPGRLWEGAARRRSAGRSPAERAGGADSNICFWDWRVKTNMSLQKVYSPYCRIGAAVSAQAFERPAALRALAEQYNSLTCENDMKPECLLDEAENCENPDAHLLSPALRFDGILNYFEFAKEHHMGMRGHTLAWHNQTPRWFFTERYSRSPSAPLAGRETMLARLDSYIRQVIELCAEGIPPASFMPGTW